MLSHASIIEAAGGLVKDGLVERAGVVEIGRSVCTASNELRNAFDIRSNMPLEEFSAKITYLSDSTRDNYIDDILFIGHNICNGDQVSILVAGVKESTVL